MPQSSPLAEGGACLALQGPGGEEGAVGSPHPRKPSKCAQLLQRSLLEDHRPPRCTTKPAGLWASRGHHGTRPAEGLLSWHCPGCWSWTVPGRAPRVSESPGQAAQEGRAWALEGSRGCKEEEALGGPAGRHLAQAPGQRPGHVLRLPPPRPRRGCTDPGARDGSRHCVLTVLTDLPRTSLKWAWEGWGKYFSNGKTVSLV